MLQTKIVIESEPNNILDVVRIPNDNDEELTIDHTKKLEIILDENASVSITPPSRINPYLHILRNMGFKYSGSIAIYERKLETNIKLIKGVKKPRYVDILDNLEF